MLFSQRFNRGPLIFLTLLLGLISIGVGKALSLSNNWIYLFLLGGLAVAYVWGVFFINRKIVLGIYLLIIVNLDYFRLLDEPFNITIDILFTLTLVLLAIPLLMTHQIRWRRTPIQKAFLLYLAATLICVYFSIDPLASMKRWIRYASYFFLISVFLDVARDKVTIENFKKCIVCSAIVPCLIGYYGLLTRHPDFLGENLRFIYGIEMVRIKSTLSHANTFGLYLGIIIPLIIGLMLRRKRDREALKNPALIGLLIFVLPILYLTYSRIGWIVTILGTFMVFALHRKWRLLTVFPWLLGFLIWRVPGFITRWSDIIDTARPDSLDWRRGLYVFSLKKFVEKPIFGSGPATFLDYVAYGKGYTQHHLWIGSLIEVGVVGTTALLILLIVLWVQLIKFTKSTPSALNRATLAIFSTLMFATIASDPFCLPSAIIYMWALISLTMAEHQLATREVSNATTPL